MTRSRLTLGLFALLAVAALLVGGQSVAVQGPQTVAQVIAQAPDLVPGPAHGFFPTSCLCVCNTVPLSLEDVRISSGTSCQDLVGTSCEQFGGYTYISCMPDGF